jgi:imidazolonepropionase-like amidohydrolase
MTPESYIAKGKTSRVSDMDDEVVVSRGRVSIVRNAVKEDVTPVGRWFLMDGYSPVAMQEQMMRWWLANGRPVEFTIYPARAAVRIAAAGPLEIGGMKMQGFTVAGLIWGEESLWMDRAGNLTALVSTDAEFDHFEAVREPYAANLGAFIAAAARAELAALNRLTAAAKSKRLPRLAISGATLVDSSGAPAVQDSVILIEDGVITAVGKRGQVAVPNDAARLDATGKWAIPGLWDMHAHYEQVEWGPIYLASGVTTVRDVGNEFDFVRTLHDALDRVDHPAIGPYLEFAGIIDGSGPTQVGAVIADSPEEATSWVERYRSAGAQQIKIYSSVKPEIVKAITAAAHARGMTVTGHVPRGMTAIDAVMDGMDQINHLEYLGSYFAAYPQSTDGRLDPTGIPELQIGSDRASQLIEILRQRGTVLDPTLATYELWAHTAPLDQLEPGVRHLPPQLKQALDSPPAGAERRPLVEMQEKIRREAIRRLHAAGVVMVAGTDQGIPGYSLHREIELYVEAGFTPLEALQSATIHAARAVGRERDVGSLQVGRRADVVLLDADPLADIRNTRRVWRTVAAGVVYEPAPLWRSVGFLP